MEYAIAKISTKGQIVIPSDMRKNINIGDEFLIVRDSDRIVLKSMKSLAKNLKADLIFAARVEKAWVEHDKGSFLKKSKNDFLEALKAC